MTTPGSSTSSRSSRRCRDERHDGSSLGASPSTSINTLALRSFLPLRSLLFQPTSATLILDIMPADRGILAQCRRSSSAYLLHDAASHQHQLVTGLDTPNGTFDDARLASSPRHAQYATLASSTATLLHVPRAPCRFSGRPCNAPTKLLLAAMPEKALDTLSRRRLPISTGACARASREIFDALYRQRSSGGKGATITSVYFLCSKRECRRGFNRIRFAVEWSTILRHIYKAHVSP